MSISYKQKMILYWLFLVVFTIACVQITLIYGLGGLAGWIYSGAFALSALPQANKSRVDGHSDGVAKWTLILWALGELAGVAYGVSLMQWPIIFNCLLNTIFVGVIIWYRLFPRKP